MTPKNLSELLDIDELKSLQRKFAAATGMGCVSEDRNGRIIKSNYIADYCLYTRLSEEGRRRCKECDRSDVERAVASQKMVISRCHTGLINFTAPIMADGKHVGAIMGGQAFDRQPDMEKIKKLAQELGIPEDRYIEAAKEIPIVPRKRIEGAAELLSVTANILSEKACEALHAEERLKKMERASNAKLEFISKLSHDIRTPIGIINNMTNFALEDINEPEKVKDELQKIRAANTYLLNLINDVLDLSKIENGNIELNPEPYTFKDFSQYLGTLIQSMCDKKGITFKIESVNTVDPIYVDKMRFNQIGMNLLSNAVKYTPAGGTVTYINDAERLPDSRVRLRVTVKDTGIGMSPKFLKKIFTPYSQELDNPLRDKTTVSTGLGMSIVAKLIELMNGTISIESEVGKGTSITWEAILPGEGDNPANTVEQTSNASEMKKTALTGRVLLVEDNEINTMIAERLLEDIGLEIDSVANGKDGVAKFNESEPGFYDVILMDIQMPVMDGVEAMKTIRKLDREDAVRIPIYALTADVYSEKNVKIDSLGFNGVLLKPMERNAIYSALSKHLKTK
ncbi:MAG: PocR ligand-binding domain-containing protein [Schwartzia sp.]|nr:PocR ligand-binding domain-containing protein [Schwartzia sp. (in: firmicutes)]